MKKTIRSFFTAAISLATLLITGSAWAVTTAPLAVWDGDFSTLTKDTYVLDLQDNVVENGVVTIGSKGLKLSKTTDVTFCGGSEGMSVIIECEDIPQDATDTAKKTLATFWCSASGIVDFDCVADKHLKVDWNKSNHSKAATSTETLPTGKHTVAFTYQGGNGEVAYVDGVKLVNAGLYTTGSGTKYIYLGSYSDNTCPATGLKISKIALFSGKLTDNDVAAFQWPAKMYSNKLASGSVTIPAETYGDISVPGLGIKATAYTANTAISGGEGSFANIIFRANGRVDVRTHTVSGWFKFDSNDCTIYAATTGGGTHGGYRLYCDSNGQLWAGKCKSTDLTWTDTSYKQVTTTALNPNTWYYLTIAITKDDGANASNHNATAVVFVNGEKVFDGTSTFATNLDGSSCSAFYIGGGVSAAGLRVDQAAVTDVATIKSWATNEELVEFCSSYTGKVINFNIQNTGSDGSVSGKGAQTTLIGSMPETSWNNNGSTKMGTISSGIKIYNTNDGTTADTSMSVGVGNYLSGCGNYAYYGDGGTGTTGNIPNDYYYLHTFQTYRGYNSPESGIQESNIKLTGIPFDKYDVIVYFNGSYKDGSNEKFHKVNITCNGTSGDYTVDATGAFVAGTADWGATRQVSSTYGVNAAIFSDVTTADFELKLAEKYANIAAFQIVEQIPPPKATATLTEGVFTGYWSDIPWDDVLPSADAGVELTIDGAVVIMQDENIAAKGITLKGSGSVTFWVADPIVNTYAGGKITTEVPLVLNADSSIDVDSGENALTYVYGGSGAITPSITCTGDFTKGGVGTISINHKVLSGKTLTVAAGTLNLDAGGQGIAGTVNISAGATMVNKGGSDRLDYNGSPVVNIYGILDMESTRWTVGANNVINMYPGSEVKGAGESGNKAWDFIGNSSQNAIHFKKNNGTGGEIIFDTTIKPRSGDVAFDVEDGVTVNFKNANSFYASNNIVKNGAGAIKFLSGSKLDRPFIVNAGMIDLSALADSSAAIITDNMTIASSVAIRFPDEFAENMPFTLCGGTLDAPAVVNNATVYVGDELKSGAVLEYDATNKTVSYAIPTVKPIDLSNKDTVTIQDIIDAVSDPTWTSEVDLTLKAGATLAIDNTTIPYLTIKTISTGGVTLDVTDAANLAKFDFAEVTGDITLKTATSINFDAGGKNLIYNYTGTGSISPSITNVGDFTWDSTGTLALNATLGASAVTINEGTLALPNNQFATYLSAASTVLVNSGAVLNLTTTGNDATAPDLSKIVGTGTVKFSGIGYNLLNGAEVGSGIYGKMPAKTLTFEVEQEGGLIIQNFTGIIDVGALSGSKGFRSDYGGSNGDTTRCLRATQYRNTTWSGNFVCGSTSDRIGTFYVAGGENATEKTLTMAGDYTGANNVLNVETTGSVKLTGSWKGNVTVAGEFGGSGSVTGASTITIANGAKVRADWGAVELNVAPTFGGAFTVTRPASGDKIITLTNAAEKYIDVDVTVEGEDEKDYILEQKTDGIYLVEVGEDGIVINVEDGEEVSKTLIDGYGYKKTGNGTLIATGITEGTIKVVAGSVRLPSTFEGTVLIPENATLVGETGHMPINGTLDENSKGKIQLPADYEIGEIIKVDFTDIEDMPITIVDSDGETIDTGRLEVVEGMLMIKTSEISTEFTIATAMSTSDDYKFVDGASIHFTNDGASLTTTGTITVDMTDKLPIVFDFIDEVPTKAYTLITAAEMVDAADDPLTAEAFELSASSKFPVGMSGELSINEDGALVLTVTSEIYTEDVKALLENNANLLRRFDATRGVATDANGVVTSWTDLSGEIVAQPYVNGQVTGAPTYGSDKIRKYVDFGAAGSGMDLEYERVTTARTVIEVIDIAQTEAAFLLGDKTDYQFHRGSAGQYGANGNAKFSTVRDNGEVVTDWAGTKIPTGIRVISLKLSQNCNTDCFASDRSGCNKNPSRTGGRKLSELLIFNTELTDEQFSTLETYLKAKWGLNLPHGVWDGEAGDNRWDTANNWKDASVPGAGSTVTIAGDTEPVIDIDGTVEVSIVQNSTFTINSGTLKITDTAKIIDSTITLGETGNLENYGWPTFTGTVTIKTNYAKSILSNTGGNPSRIEGAPNFVKDGTGTLTLLSSAGGNTNPAFASIIVNGGKLVLGCTGNYVNATGDLKLYEAGAIEIVNDKTFKITGRMDLTGIDEDDGVVGGAGTLQVTETTTYAFPEGFDAGDEFVLTTGTLSAPTTAHQATITVGGVEKTVFLSYDATKKCVSYSESENIEITGEASISAINTQAGGRPAVVTIKGENAAVKFDAVPTAGIKFVKGEGAPDQLKLTVGNGKRFVSLAEAKQFEYEGFSSFKYEWAAGEVISLNFGTDRTDYPSSMTGEGKTDTFAGVQIPDASWINLTGGNSTDVAVDKFYDSDADATFDISGMTVSYNGGNNGTWKPATQSNYPFMNGYLDDNDANSPTVTIKNVPFSTYDVIVYMQGDNGSRTFTPIQINDDLMYTYDSTGAIVSGTDFTAENVWGLENQTDISYEHNVIRITDLSGETKIKPLVCTNTGLRRGTLAAIQIVNTGTPLVTKWIRQDYGVASAWDNADNWNNGVPTANTIAVIPAESWSAVLTVTDASVAKLLDVMAMEVSINGSGAQFGGLVCDYGLTINGGVDPIVIAGTIAGESSFGVAQVSIDSGVVKFDAATCNVNVFIKGNATLAGSGTIHAVTVEKDAILKPNADGFVITGAWAQNSGAEIKPIKIDCSLITASDVESAITLISLDSDCTGIINDVTFEGGATGLVFVKSADNKSIIASKTCIWTGAGENRNWSNTDNWQGGVVPMAGIPVIINLGTDAGEYTINLPDSAVEVDSLTLSGSATSFAFTGAGSLSATSYDISGLTATTLDLSKTTFNADYTIPANSTLIVNGATWTSEATLGATTSKFRYDGAYTAINGTFAGEKGTVEIGGTFTADGDVSLSSNTVMYAFDGAVAVNGNLTVGLDNHSIAYFNRGTINANKLIFGCSVRDTGSSEDYYLGDGTSANGTMVINVNEIGITRANGTGLHVHFRQGCTVNLGAGGIPDNTGSDAFYRNWNLEGGKIAIAASTSVQFNQLRDVINRTEFEVAANQTLTFRSAPFTNSHQTSGTIVKTGDGSIVFDNDPLVKIEVAGGDATIAAGLESRITVVEGGTLKLKVTDAQWITGYTSTATIPDGADIVFIAPDGTVIPDTTGKVLPRKPASKTWVGDTGNWDVADNWNPSGVPSATDTVRIESTTDLAITLPTDGATVAGATFVGDNAITLVDGAFTPGAFAKIGAGTLSMTLGADNNQPMNIEGTVAFVIPEETTRTLSGIISGSGKIVKNGAGELVLSGANTFTGGTEITAGTLKSSNAAALGAGNGTAQDPDIVIANGAKLDFAQGNCTAAYWIVSNGGEITNTGSDIGNANNGIKGLTLGGNTTISGNKMSFFTNGQGATAIELNGHTLDINLNSNKELTLTSCTISGEGLVNVNSGILASRAPSAQTDITFANCKVVVKNGASLLAGWNFVFEDIEFEDGMTVSDNGENDRNITVNGTAKFDGSATWSTYITLIIGATGTLESSVSIPKITFADGATVKKVGDTVASINGTSALTLSGTIKLDVTGKTAEKLPAGTEIDVFMTTTEITEDDIGDIIAASEQNFQPYVKVSEDATPVYTVGVMATYEAEVTWDGTSGDWTATSFNGIPGNYGDDQQTAIFTDAASGTDAITVTVVEGPRTVKGISFNAARNITINGNVVVNGAITKTGAGRAEITGTTTVSGAISVTEGTLAINFAADYAQAIPVNGVLEVNVPQGVTRTLSGVISGSGKVVKTGAGTLVLSAVNTFTGGLEINEGIVKAGAEKALGGNGTGEVHVANGATLDNNGQKLVNTIYLIGDGVDGNGAFVNNSSSDMGNGINTKIRLTGDASWGGAKYFHFGNASDVQLNGFTFTKKGTNAFPVRDTTIKGPGKIVVAEGQFNNNAGNNTLQNVDLEVRAGATLNMAGASLSVRDFTCNGTITGTSATLKVNGTIHGGATIPKLELFDGSKVALAQGESITVGNTLTLPTEGKITLDVTGYNTIGDYTVITAPNDDTWDTNKVEFAGNEGWEMYVEGNELKVKLLTLDADISTSEGYNYTGVSIDVDVTRIAEGETAFIKLVVKDTNGASIGEIAQVEITGKGLYQVPVENLTTGADYTYEVTIVDENGDIIEGSKSDDGTVTLGDVQKSDLFSASAETGASVVDGGSWTANEPEIPTIESESEEEEIAATNATYYQIADDVTSVFTVADTVESGDLVSIDFEIAFDDGFTTEIDPTEDTPPQAGVTISAEAESATKYWYVCDNGAWKATTTEAIPGAYTVTMEFDYPNKKVRYSINGTPLTDGSKFWFDNGVQDATKIATVAFTGDSRLTKFGANAVTIDTNLAANGNTKYATVTDVVNAINAGTSITLLTNVSIDSADLNAGVYTIDLDGNKFKWSADVSKFITFKEGKFVVKAITDADKPKNGVDSYTSYVFNLDAEEPTDKPFIKQTGDVKADKLTFKCYHGLNGEPITAISDKATYQIEVATDPAFGTDTVLSPKAKVNQPIDVELPSGTSKVLYYRAKLIAE